MRDEKAGEAYRRELAATAGQQAAFFREQARHHRDAAEQARVFAELTPGGTARAEQRRRAERLETLGSHDDVIAEALEARARQPL